MIYLEDDGQHLLLIQRLLGTFMVSLIVHPEGIFTGTCFITDEAVISGVLDMLGLYVLRHVTLDFGAIGTFTTVPDSS